MAVQPIKPVSLDAIQLTGAAFDQDAEINELYKELKGIVFDAVITTQINDMAVVGALEILKDDMLQHIRDAKYADEAYDE